MKSYILKTDGTKIEITPKNGRDFKCEEIHQHLKTEANPDPCFTMVRLTGRMLMLAEDNGYALGLNYNKEATALYKSSGGIDPIVGQVMICPVSMVK